jgi:hypothetical protein
MRACAVFAVGLLLGSAAHAGPAWRTVVASGVSVRVPPGWQPVDKAGDGPVVDPRTVLVVGSRGVRPRPSACQIAAYRIPPHGAAVIVVRWRTETSGGARPPRSREPLRRIALHRSGFECWPGHRGGAAAVALGGHAYQVNVLVGDLASRRKLRDALAVARSFALARRRRWSADRSGRRSKSPDTRC